MTNENSRKITLGIPKGSLQESTLLAFERVGLRFTGDARTLWLRSSDVEIDPVLLKPQEIPLYVKTGRLDAGLSGRDWIVEQDVAQHVRVLTELPFSRQTQRPMRWVLAVPDRSEIRTVEDLREEADRRRSAGSPFLISTELLKISQMWLARNGIDANVEFSWGATEAKAEYFSDAIIEGSETGTSLRANHLREIVEVFSSTNQFFANRHSYEKNEWKRKKLDGISHLLTGAVRANDLVEMRVVAEAHSRFLPLLKEILENSDGRIVTVSQPKDGSPFSASVTLSRSAVPRVLPEVIAAGATDAWVIPMTIHYSHSDDLLT